MADLTGALLDGRYRVVRKIGAGGMGEVWLALQQSLGREVALKVIKQGDADPEHLVRFQREARAISKVKHDNVVVVFDTGTCPQTGVAFIAMEHLAGRTLRSRMRDGAMSVMESISIVRQLVHALQAAHATGIIHRDVKPENVVLVDQPAGRLKLLDFGIARPAVAGDTLTRTGMLVGTPAYTAPELVMDTAPAGPKSDLYAVGVVWFEMLASRKIVEGTNAMAVAVRQASEDAPRLSTLASVPAWVDDIVARLLERDPARRPTAPALLRALDDAATVGMTSTMTRGSPRPAATDTSTTDVRGARAAAATACASAEGTGDTVRVFQSPWLVIDVDEARKIVRYTRTKERIELADIDLALSSLSVEPRGLDRSKYGALADVRAPKGRSDGFDDLAQRHFARLSEFRRVAALARSAVGRLQIGRQMRRGGDDDRILVTDDEREALAFLAADD